MARPLPSGKKSVDLASSSDVRISRIRRDPPPKVKEKLVDSKEVERQDVIVGVLVFTLAIFVITLAISYYWGWTPTQYTLEM